MNRWCSSGLENARDNQLHQSRIGLLMTGFGNRIEVGNS
jgi:hypothetical protein